MSHARRDAASQRARASGCTGSAGT
jgi:hypothetical protein